MKPKSHNAVVLSAAALIIGLPSIASAAVISNFNSPDVSGPGFTAYSSGDGWKGNLTNLTSGGLAVNPGFIATHSGSDGIGMTVPNSITSPGGQYGYSNAGGGRAASMITENAFVTSATMGATYTLSVDLGRRSDGIGSNAGRYVFGFLANYNAGQTDNTTFTNFNTLASGFDETTASFGTNGSLLGYKVVNYLDIGAGTFQTFTTDYVATGGETLKAFVIYDNTSGGFGQSAFDNLSFEVVPEPSSAMLLLSGLGGFALFRRRN